MKYCGNCGKKLIKNSKYCDNCGSKVIDDNQIDNKKSEELEDGNWLVYVIIWGILVLCGNFISKLYFPCFALRLIVVVMAEIKYPKVKIIDVLFWIQLMYFIFYFAMIVLALIMCGKSINDCSVLGRIMFL